MSKESLMQQVAHIALQQREEMYAVPPDESDDLARPLDDTEKDAIARSTLDNLAGRVIDLRRWTRVGLAASALGVAASLALFLGTRKGNHAELPEYELTIVGNQSTFRAEGQGKPGSLMSLSRGGELQLFLRPSTSTASQVALRAYVQHAGVMIPWPVEFQVSEGQAVRINVPAGGLSHLPTGESTLVLFVGTPEKLPTSADQAARCWKTPCSPEVRALGQAMRLE